MTKHPDLELGSIRAFVRSREVEFVLAPSEAGADLRLLACFDGYGEFFSIFCFGVEYVCMPGGIEVGEVELEPLHVLSQRRPELQPLVGTYSGLTLLVLADDGSDSRERCVVVANQIVSKAGKEWVR